MSAILSLTGCDHTWRFDRSPSVLGNAQFVAAWKTYLHCRASLKPEEIRADLHQLTRVAYSVTQQRQATPSLPTAIRSFVSNLPLRLSVDPHAMSVACALHGSEVAQAAGRPEVSIELLTAVVATQQGRAIVSSPVGADGRSLPVEDLFDCSDVATTDRKCLSSESWK